MWRFPLFLSFPLIVSFLHTISANEIMTPVGVVKIPCLPNSDTIVGLPTRQNADYEGSISVAPDTTTISGSAILTLTGNPGLTAAAFANTHYVKFANSNPAATGDGQWFTITTNDASTLTVDLNGGSIDAVAGAELEVLKFWTLNELFPPAECTTDAATTGNAIVAAELSPSVASPRATELRIPNISGSGIDLAAGKAYTVFDGVWYDLSDPSTGDAGNTQLWPDVYFIIRHGTEVSQATSYTSIGEVEMGNLDIPLSTQKAGQQDNHIAIPRPIDVTLNELNLGGTKAFVGSTSELVGGRMDELRVYDNTQAMIDKSPSAIYFYYSGAWRKDKLPGIDFGNDIIPKGAGFIIRKAQTVDGATHIWKNTPSYPAL